MGSGLLDDLVITQADDKGVPVLRLRGGLDLLTLPGLQGALAAIPLTVPQVVLDMHALEFIDSTGVRGLLQADFARRAVGGSLVFIAPTDGTFARTVRLLRLLDRLDVRDDDPGSEGDGLSQVGTSPGDT
jgi:anti-anti-sigma factor